jgi:hypothetical protein
MLETVKALESASKVFAGMDAFKGRTQTSHGRDGVPLRIAEERIALNVRFYMYVNFI